MFRSDSRCALVLYTAVSLHAVVLIIVPLNSKLTVSTSILDPRSFLESRIENRESSFENRVSRIENRVSRIEFRVSRHSKNFSRISNRDFEETIKFSKNKTIAMNKVIDARLYSRKPALNICKYFRVVHFLQGICSSLICIYTEADNSMTAS